MSQPDYQWQPAAQSMLAALAAHLGNLKQLPLPQGGTEDYVQALSDLLEEGLAAVEQSYADPTVKLQRATRRALEAASQGICRASAMALEALRPTVARMSTGVITWKDKEAMQLVGLARQLGRCAHYVLALAEMLPDVLSSSVTANRIALAGTAVTGVASLVLDMGIMVHPSVLDDVESHVFRLDTLLKVLNLVQARQPQVFAALRASTFSPAVITSCLSKILAWHRRAMASESFPASADGSQKGLHKIAVDLSETLCSIFSHDLGYSCERTAIATDGQLQDTIIAFMTAVVEDFAGGTGPPSRAAICALNTLSSPPLAAGLCARATRPGGGFVSLIGRALARLLARPVKMEDDKDPSLYRGLFSGVGAINLVFTAGRYPQPANTPVFVAGQHPQLLEELLGTLLPAVAAVMALLEWECAEEDRDMAMVYCREGAVALLLLLAQFDEPGMRAALARRPLEVVGIMEALPRLAQIRSSQAATPAGQSLSIVVEDLRRVAMALLVSRGDLQAALKAAPKAAFLSRDGLSAVAALLQTTAKLGFLLAKERNSNRDADNAAFVLGLQQASMLLLEKVTSGSSDSSGGGDVSGEAPTQNLRRWQAVALAMSAAVASLAEREGRGLLVPWGGGTFRGARAFSLLLNMVCSWSPGVCSTVMATAAGSAAAMRAFAIFKVTLGDIPNATAIRLMLVDTASSSPPTALALARSGTLAELVTWGEANCPGLITDAEVRRTLTLISAAVEQACSSAGSETIREALAGIPTAQFSFCVEPPAYWQRLRAEVVDPLAAVLAARPANAAAAADVAADVAEALATRPCAHPGCTAIVGPGEAGMPHGKRCSGCRLVRYCGAACQRADWKAHKAACRELQRRREPAA